MNKKNIISIGAALLITIMLISTATAAPITNREAVDHQINTDQKINNIPETNCFKKIKDLLERLKYMWINLRGIDSLMGGDEIIDTCWEYYDEPTFWEKQENFKAELENKINELPVEIQDLARSYFDSINVFVPYNIAQRIGSLHPGSVIEDTQKYIMEAPDSYTEFEQGYYPQHNYNFDLLMELIYNHYANNVSMDILMPVVDFLCYTMLMISMTWVMPLYNMPTCMGLAISNYVTVVFYAPFILAISDYCACRIALANDERLQAKLHEIVDTYGLTGLFTYGLPLVMQAVYMKGYMDDGSRYVLNRLLVREYDMDTGMVITSEVAPNIRTFDWSYTKTTADMSVLAEDEDVIKKPNDCQCRDYMQIGFDWDNDGDVDGYTILGKSDTGCTSYIFDMNHNFESYGTYTIGCLVRDHWGIRSDFSTYTLLIPKAKPYYMFSYLDGFPLIQRILTLLKGDYAVLT